MTSVKVPLIAVVGLIGLCALGCSNTDSSPNTPLSDPIIVSLVTQDHCIGVGDRPVVCYNLSVYDPNIATKNVTVRAYHRTDALGAVILGVGGYGTSYYSNFGPEAVETIETLYGTGLEVYEIRWDDPKGWAHESDGHGYAESVEGYSSVVEWLSENAMNNPELVYAQGNSGGSIQIAFGLALYGLDQIVDVAILSGGPPVADLRRGIFGELDDESRWPDDLAGLGVTDYLMGWENNGEYCIERAAPQNILALIDEASLVSPTRSREYSYSADVYFVESDDETNADHQGFIYYEALTSSKYWHYLSTTTEHRVPSTPEGAEMIRTIITTDLAGR